MGDYAANATPQSCLIVVDGRANASNNVIPYYTGLLEYDVCAMDARDPRFHAIVVTHPDLWWAIGTQYYQRESVRAFQHGLSGTATVQNYRFALLVHPSLPIALSSGSGHSAGAFLEQSILALEPVGSTIKHAYPALRESFANLLILECGSATPVETIRSLLSGYLLYDRIDINLTWDRAEARLARGDIDGATTLAVRLVGISPGNPDVYRLLARIALASGNSDASSRYTWAAENLMPDAPSSDVLHFNGCS